MHKCEQQPYGLLRLPTEASNVMDKALQGAGSRNPRLCVADVVLREQELNTGG